MGVKEIVLFSIPCTLYLVPYTLFPSCPFYLVSILIFDPSIEDLILLDKHAH